LKESFVFAFKKTLPILCGYIFLGTAFGLIMENNSLGFLPTVFASVFIFAGSLQLIMGSLLFSEASLITIATMTLLTNSRHIFYGLSFIERFKSMGKKYFYMIFSLTDETYSVLCTVPKNKDDNVFFLIALLNQMYWITGSIMGYLIGQNIGFNLEGIDFSMTALFVVIFVEKVLTSTNKLPGTIGIGSSILVLTILGPDKFILPSLILTVALLMILENKIEG